MQISWKMHDEFSTEPAHGLTVSQMPTQISTPAVKIVKLTNTQTVLCKITQGKVGTLRKKESYREHEKKKKRQKARGGRQRVLGVISAAQESEKSMGIKLISI